jgi:DNA-binding NarL/FixJ family response regulator
MMGDVTVAGEAANGDEVMATLKHGQFDLILLDLSMPGVTGHDLIEQIHTQYPRLPILVFSMRNEPKIAQGALQAGASGYLAKECDQDTLVFAIRKVAAGKRFVDASIVEQVMLNSKAQDNPPTREHLSERELQIMKRLAKGMPLTAIAEELEINTKTVSSYKSRLMKKMNFKSNAELMMCAVEYGMTNKR